MYHVPCDTERQNCASIMKQHLDILRRECVILRVEGLPVPHTRGKIVIDEETTMEFHMSMSWLSFCKRRKTYNKHRSSYDYKDVVENSSGIDISHGIMILAMLAAGFTDIEEIKRSIALHLHTIHGRISENSPAMRNRLLMSLDSMGSLRLAIESGWSPNLHRFYSPEFKGVTKNLLELKLLSDSTFYLFPNELLFLVIIYLS